MRVTWEKINKAGSFVGLGSILDGKKLEGMCQSANTQTALQRLSIRLQRYGGAVRAHGFVEDPVQSAEQG